jgi:hypothetical protein
VLVFISTGTAVSKIEAREESVSITLLPEPGEARFITLVVDKLRQRCAGREFKESGRKEVKERIGRKLPT